MSSPRPVTPALLDEEFLSGRPAFPIPVVATAASELVWSVPTVIRGWSFRETTGTGPAVIRLRDGLDNTGTLVAPIGLSTSESTRDWLGNVGIWCGTGIWLQVVSGTVEGSIWATEP